MTTVGRKGFTLVELLVVLVLGSILVLSTYQVLATNTRVYADNGARVQGQQTLRGAAEILSGELREISTPGGDLITMARSSLTIRGQRTYGLVCAVDYTMAPAELSTWDIGPRFEAGDSIFVFHDNDPDRVADDEWFVGVVGSVADTVTCNGWSGQKLRLPFVTATATASQPDSVRIGAPVRGFERFTYGAYLLDGETYLGRQGENDPTPVPLVGPILRKGGLEFRYLDERGQVTNVDTLVAQIEVTLRYQSAMRTFQNELVSDSLIVRVYPRN